MKGSFISALAAVLLCASVFVFNQPSRANEKPGGGDKMNSIYDFSLKDIDHKQVSLSQYRGKVVMKRPVVTMLMRTCGASSTASARRPV